MLKKGDAAPDFALKDQNNNDTRLSDFRGQKVALYFYPKDDTPGCAKQACSLRDGFSELSNAKIKIFGVSPDDAGEILEAFSS